LTSELAPYLVAAGFPVLLLAVFALFQWRYRQAIVRTVHIPAEGFDDVEDPSQTHRADVPALVLDWVDATVPRSRPAARAFAIAQKERQRISRAFIAGCSTYLLAAAVVVWHGQAAAGVSPRVAAALGYFSTLPSILLVVAFSGARARTWVAIGVAWLVIGYLMLVGALHIRWLPALSVMLNGIEFASFALISLALLVLRTARTLLVGAVPAVALWFGLGLLAEVMLGFFGLSFTGHFTMTAMTGGAIATVIGLALAIDRIRRGIGAGFLSLLIALFVVGVVFSGSPRLGLLAAVAAGVAFNAMLALAVWWLLRHFVALKARGHLSDDVLHVVMCWIVLTVFLGALSRSDAASIPTLLVPFALATMSLMWLLHRQQRRAAATVPKRMLLLRTFGRATLRRRLLHALDDTWRSVGSLDMVVGVDVAPATISALALEDFLIGRIDRQFIRSVADLSEHIQRSIGRRSIDGRYPLNDLHCSTGAWRDVVARLAVEADVVLMDLRGFQVTNRGASFELALLVRDVPLSRVIVLTDAATDEALLSRIATNTWSRLPRSSPNAHAFGSRLRLVRCSGSRRDSAVIIDQAFSAAFDAKAEASGASS
jgi:hypothetical protein